MIVTVTSIKLKSVWYYFRLTMFGYKIVKQLKHENGFLKMKNTGFGYDHYTISVWESEEDLKRFARRGAHSEAMKQTKKIASEVRTYTYTTELLPGWSEVKNLLNEKGKVLVFK